MHVEVPALMFKVPESWATKDRETGAPDGGTMYAHALVIEGEAVKLYSQEDKSLGLNGQREQLGGGEGVAVNVVLDLSPRNGTIKPKLAGIVARGK
jgi:hypothetical protein